MKTEPQTGLRERRHPAPHTTLRELVTLDKLQHVELPEPRWAVPTILPEGLSILAGKPKLGKSWLALNLALAVGMGGVALGTERVERGGVLYLALEDNPRRMKDRVSSILRDGNWPENVHIGYHWPRIGDGCAEAIEEHIRRHDTRLVIVDTLAKVKPHVGRNADSYAADYAALEPLKQVADMASTEGSGVAILLIHHTRKADAEDDVDTISGTTGLSGAADGALILKRARGENTATLYVTGRDVDEQELGLRWDPALCQWTIVGDAATVQRTHEQDATLDLLRRAGRPLSPKEVAELLGIGLSAAKMRLLRMANDGAVVQPATGRYTLPRELDEQHAGTALRSRAVCLDDVTSVTDVTGVTRVTGVTGAESQSHNGGVTVQSPMDSGATAQSHMGHTHMPLKDFVAATNALGLDLKQATERLGVKSLAGLDLRDALQRLRAA